MSSLNTFKSAALVVWVLASTNTAHAQAKSCLPRDDAMSLVIYALPGLVTTMRQKCLATLPATSTLSQAGPLIAARYQPDSDAAWPDAKTAFVKIAQTPVAGLLGDSVRKALIRSTIEQSVSSQIKPADCPHVDQIINDLHPLPTRNLASVVISFVQISEIRTKRNGQLNVCAAPSSVTPVVSLAPNR
jgi:hypothetical protein